MTNAQLARRAYTIIDSKASSNMVIQGLSGIMGFPFTLIADGAVLFTHYGTMLNEIRDLYAREPVNESVISDIIGGISNELLFDVVMDKFLGNVPLIGIYFNSICAKTMTWRLGILFTMLAARGESIDGFSVAQTTKLIRQVFPQTDAFSFKKPKYSQFEKMVVSVTDNSQDQFNSKINKALGAFED